LFQTVINYSGAYTQKVKSVFNIVIKNRTTDVKMNGTASLKNVNNYLNTNIYSYLETSGGQISDLYLNVVHFFNTSVD